MQDSQSEHVERINPIKTRLLRQDDIAAIIPILERWVVHWETGKPIREEIDEIIQAMKNSIDDPKTSTYLVVETSLDGVIGVVGIRLPIKEMLPFVTTSKTAELTNFFIAEKHRGKGVG